MPLCESCSRNKPAKEIVIFTDGDPFRVCHACADDAGRYGDVIERVALAQAG